MKNEVRKLDNSPIAYPQKIFTIPQELLDEAMDVLQDLRRSICPIEQIRPLSIAEAAKALRCRRKEVEQLINDGILPFIKRHGRRYILPVDIHRRLKEEAGFENSDHNKHRKNRISKRIHSKIQDIDPILREFFD